MPATAREPSGRLVDVLCGQPEQNHGLRSVTTRGLASAFSFASMIASRACMRARMSAGSSSLPMRATIAFETIAGENS